MGRFSKQYRGWATALPALILSALLFPSVCAGQDAVMPDQWDLDELVNYGNWIRVEPFGTVWQPMVTEDWQPFFYGHWLHADDGWTWISYEPFGWIVYHYGNWYNDAEFGWIWIPVRGIWSPARVVWEQFGNSVCWAPIPPEGFDLPDPWTPAGRGPWVIVGRADFAKENVGKFRMLAEQMPPEGGAILRNEPDPGEIAGSGGQVRHQSVPRIPVHVGELEIQRMDLPSGESSIVEHHRRELERHVLRPARRGAP